MPLTSFWWVVQFNYVVSLLTFLPTKSIYWWHKCIEAITIIASWITCPLGPIIFTLWNPINIWCSNVQRKYLLYLLEGFLHLLIRSCLFNSSGWVFPDFYFCRLEYSCFCLFWTPQCTAYNFPSFHIQSLWSLPVRMKSTPHSLPSASSPILPRPLFPRNFVCFCNTHWIHLMLSVCTWVQNSY